MFALQSAEETLKILRSTRDGLSKREVQKRQQEYGFNELPEHKRSLLLLFLRQFHSIFVYILLLALILSALEPLLSAASATGADFLESGAIGAILLLNAMLGFIQEYKTEEAIAMLRKLSSPHVRVRRDGKDAVIASRDLVPGDIVIVEAGDKISADGRVLKAAQLSMNESSLTGESQAVGKTTATLRGDPPLPERINMVFAGTVVTAGTGDYVVTATGKEMELGKIASLVSETEAPPTPLQLKLNRLSLQLGGVVSVMAVVVMLLKLREHAHLTETMLLGISLAVSAVPEGLPAVVTACLAIGVRRMAKRNVLVRRLEALETLGSVTVICTDKTGTVTENRMKVQAHWLADTAQKSEIALLAQIAASCNHAQLPDVGDPTEVGLLQFAKQQKVERLPIDEEPVPFSSELKYMATRHGDRLFLKGAPEKIFSLCDASDTQHAAKETHTLAMKGLRVLACAVQHNGHTRLVGLLALEDPPKQGVKEAIAKAKTAGIRTIMITGDNADTARAIGKTVGITGEVIEGKDLMEMSMEILTERVRTAGVFARVSPEHKLMILEALKKNGEIVAMSGDGVNDAPALKGAHVGIAMGKIGTDVARDAASIVLTDDHFATIVAAIEEGRHIYDNIRKFILLLLQMNFYELLFFLISTLLGLPIPYLPLHILWINLLTDGLPALSLAMEPTEPSIMLRPPRNPREHVFSGQSGNIMLATVLPLCIVLYLYLQSLVTDPSLEHTRTVIFSFAVFFELLFVSTVRSSRPLHEIGFFTNRWLVAAVSIPLVLHILLIATPLRLVFGLTPLFFGEWVALVLWASCGLLLFEAIKIVRLWHAGTLFAYRR